MTLYKIDRGEITEAGTNTVVNGCDSILVYAENELHAGWVGLLFDADKITENDIVGAFAAAHFPDYIDTRTATIILGVKQRRVENYCQILGFEKIGGIYLLSVEQLEQIWQYKLLNPPGRPKKK